MTQHKKWPFQSGSQPKTEPATQKAEGIETVATVVKEEKEPSVPLSEVQRMIDEAISKSAPQQTVTEQRPSKPYNRDFGVSEAIEGLPELDYVDRYYTTVSGKKPVTLGIRNRNKKNAPLQWVNPVNKMRYSLKYGSNQTTFIEDFQKGEVVLQSIVMRDGFLMVPKENILLQQFLAVHPDRNIIFREIDKAKDAKVKVSALELETKAVHEAMSMDYGKLKSLAMVCLTDYNESMSPFETKELIYVYAKNNPQRFLDLSKDDKLYIKGLIRSAVFREVIKIKGRKFVSGDTDNVIYDAPYGYDELDAFATYLQADSEGRDYLEFLKNKLN